MSEHILHSRLFGLLELTLGGEALPLPSSAKARSLLAYLILHRDGPIPRDRLLGIFWPERPGARARRALSQELWRVRSALGPAAVPMVEHLARVLGVSQRTIRRDLAALCAQGARLSKNVHKSSPFCFSY